MVSLLMLCGCTWQVEPSLETPGRGVTPPPTVTPTPDKTEKEEPEPPEPVVATLAVCGDIMSHMPVTNDAWDKEQGIYDYYRIMRAAEPYVGSADFAVANLETTLSGGPKYSGFPTFNSPDDLAGSLKKLGFDLLLTANNHSLDQGNSGLRRTLDVLDEAGLAHVGTSRTREEYETNIQVADVGGISVAFLGYTYGTNGLSLPQDAPYAVNLFNRDYLTRLSEPDTEKLLSDLESAKLLDTDLITVMIHWGVEYKTSPSAYQKELAELLFAGGADLILGGHPHVPQPMELREIVRAGGKVGTGFVCYSLGNFISAQNDLLTDTTAVLMLELTKDLVTEETQVTNYAYHPMLMLDRESGPGRFELLDISKTLEEGAASDRLTGNLERALESCRAIMGEAGIAID